jgi:hypothetical protein
LPAPQTPWDFVAAPVTEGGIRHLYQSQYQLAHDPRHEDFSFTEPLLDFTQWTPDHGVMRGVASFVSGLTSPTNLALMAATGGLGGIESELAFSLSRYMGGALSAQAIKGVLDESPEIDATGKCKGLGRLQ